MTKQPRLAVGAEHEVQVAVSIHVASNHDPDVEIGAGKRPAEASVKVRCL